jgi:DNA-binding CsgD family transcriptional regulator
MTIQPSNTKSRLARGLAIGASVVYLALLCVGWVMNAPAGFDGILRPQPHEVPGGAGFTVLEVEPGSPADAAGVRPGDRVTAVDGNPFLFDIHQTFHNRRASTEGSLRVVTPGQDQRVAQLTLQSRLASPSIVLNLTLASLLGIMIMAVGACVAFVRPDSAAARLLLAFALALACSTLSDMWHWTQRTAASASALDQVAGTVGLLGAAALLHLFLIFPAPGALYARFRRAIPLLYVAALAPLVLAIVAGGGAAALVSMLLLAVLLLSALLSLELSYRNPATPLARAQLGWVRWGLAVGVATNVASGIARLLTPEGVPAVVSAVVSLAWLVFPVSIALAVLRYRLFEVDRVMRASITWGLLAALLLGGYLVVVIVLGRLAASLLGPSIGAAGDPTVSIVAALVVAGVAHPLRVRLQSALDHLVYRQRFARAQVIEQATELLSQPQPSDAIAGFLCRAAPRSLGLSGGWLAAPATEAALFEVDPGVLLPNVSLASPALIDVARDVAGPLLIAPAEDLAAYEGMPTLSADLGGLRPWYTAGARALVPLRSGGGDVLALWILGAPASGDLLDRADLAAFARLAALAEMQLERRRAHKPIVLGRDSDVLTVREQEVYALLARGCSNREIADELVISVRTAETHVEHVLRKLNLDSRAQVILAASERTT